MWTGRVRNIWADLEGSERAVAMIPAVVFCAVGLAVAWLAVADPSESVTRRVTGSAAVFTIGYWMVRAVLIALNDHALGFVVVHTVLAIVSVSAAAWAWRVVDREDPCEVDGGASAVDGGGEDTTVAAGSDAGGL